MLIKIYGKIGNLKAEVSADSSSTQVKEIQGDNVLSLSFTLPQHIAFDVDDYADFEGERYWLTRQYRPKQKSTVEWSYNLRMYGVESLIKNILVIKSVDGDDEPVFSLTASPREHVGLIVSCLNRGFNTTDWKVGIVDGTDNVTIDYRGKYCDEALRELAEHVGVEYWAEGTTVNLCRCEHGESITLGYGKGLTSLDCGEASNVKFYTHLFPVGSSRNIDPAKYGSSRLHLPGNQRFVEVNADKYSRVDHYEESAFADIYPRYTGTVSSVRSEEVTGQDGNRFTIYYFKDSALPFDPNDYEIGGLVKRVSFQTGDLAGLGNEDQGTYYFEVNFDSTTREYEIITIWPSDDDTQLPGATLIPKPGDTYIPWNIRMPDEYYPIAEVELLAAVNEYNTAHALDVAVYKAPTDHVWIEQNNIVLTVGQRVRLESEKYFPGASYRDSRITKISRKVNLPSQMDLEIGDALSRRTLDKVQDNITGIRNYVESGKIAMPDLIRTGDATLPTDSNAYSARRSDKQYLRKDRPDTAAGRIDFKQGATYGDFIAGLWAGKGAAIDANGNAEVETLRVRSRAEFMELVFNRLTAMEGDYIFTEADTIDRVVEIENADGSTSYGLYLRSKWDGYFTAMAQNDVIKGIINTLAAGSGTYATSWMRVNSVNTAANYIEAGLYADDECPAGVNSLPQSSMTIARYGNQTDKTRQSCLLLSSYDGRITKLSGVTKPKLADYNYGITLGTLPEFAYNLKTITGRPVIADPKRDYLFADGVITRDLIQVDKANRPVCDYVYRGDWSATESYYCEEQNPDTGRFEISRVSYCGCVWQCAKNLTQTQPRWNNTDWAFYEGNPDFTVNFADQPDYIVVDPDGFSLALTVIAKLHNIDITQDILDADVEWTRYSEDAQGNPRTASDNAWALTHAGAGKSMTITEADCDMTAYIPKTLRFTAKVTLRDGEGNEVTHEKAALEL